MAMPYYSIVMVSMYRGQLLKKMASDEDTCSVALEEIYSKLFRLELPFSLAGELQSRQLTLDSSVWTVKVTKSGVSVSLFWQSSRLKTSKKKNKKKRNNKSSSSVQDSVVGPEMANSTSVNTSKVVKQATPTGKVDKLVDLCSCSSVQYDGISGVLYTNQLGQTGWTPVRQVRRSSSRSHRTHSQTSPPLMVQILIQRI